MAESLQRRDLFAVAFPWILLAGLEVAAASWFRGLTGALLGWIGLCTLWMGLAYVVGRPHALGKGRWWQPALAPMVGVAWLCARGAQWIGMPDRSEILPGLWVGGWPRGPLGGMAQLDLTAELPRRPSGARYASVPMLDGAPPGAADLRAAVAHVLAWRREGHPVLVHCAYGRGRSVAVLCGVLLAEGHARSPGDALAAVQAARPIARLTRAQAVAVARAFAA